MTPGGSDGAVLRYDTQGLTGDGADLRCHTEGLPGWGQTLGIIPKDCSISPPGGHHSSPLPGLKMTGMHLCIRVPTPSFSSEEGARVEPTKPSVTAPAVKGSLAEAHRWSQKWGIHIP